MALCNIGLAPVVGGGGAFLLLFQKYFNEYIRKFV